MTCKCGETISKTDNAPETVVITPAACEADAVVKYTAKVTVDGKELTNETEEITLSDTAKGHSFTAYVYNNDATCTVDGTETATCDNGCGKTDTSATDNITVPGTATGEPSQPDTPSKPDKPSESGKCKWCGKTHKGFWQSIVGFWHNFFYFFAHLFGKR